MSKVIEDIGTLKINLLSQAQYDAEKAGGRLADDELYLTPSSGTGVSDVEVNGSSVVSGGVAEIELKTINQNSIVGSGNIDIQGGAGVFVAEYGVTLYADIRDAILDGQSVICLMQDDDLMITLALADYDFDYGLIDFSVLAQSMGNYVSVYSNDEWASAVFSIAPNDMASTSRAGLMSASDKTKLDGIASGAEVNVQSNWSQSDSTADDYIKNKPTIPTVNDATLTIQKNGSTVNTFTANASSNVTANITVPTDTDDLTNGAGYITSSALPTKVSDLTNDAGYITGYTETDPTVPSWAKASSKPSYTFSEIGSKPTTLSGYGITDAKIASGTITLGSNTITPLTSETDPIFTASDAYGIDSTDITNWDNSYAGKISLDTTAASGTTDGDLYAAIVALGWDSDVIE